MIGIRIPKAEPGGPITDEHYNAWRDATETYGITVDVGSGLEVRHGVIRLVRKLEGWIKVTSHTSGADYLADRVERKSGAWVATAYVGEKATESSGYASISIFPVYARAVWEEDRWIFQADQC